MTCISDFIRLLMLAAYRHQRAKLRFFGEMFGVPRFGESLVVWYARIKLRLTRLPSGATIGDVKTIVSIATGINRDEIRVSMRQPGAVVVRLPGWTPWLCRIATQALREHLPMTVEPVVLELEQN